CPPCLLNDFVRNDPHGDGTKVFEYDVAKTTFRQTGVLPDSFRLNRDHTRALAFWKRPAIEIYDAGTGALLTKIERRGTRVRFLDDGGIAAANGNLLEIFSPGGALIRTINLPRTIEWMADAGGGRVVVAMRTP